MCGVRAIETLSQMCWPSGRQGTASPVPTASGNPVIFHTGQRTSFITRDCAYLSFSILCPERLRASPENLRLTPLQGWSVNPVTESYHDDRIHDALKKETPNPRVVEPRPRGTAKGAGIPRVGGLHHRYQWQTAA